MLRILRSRKAQNTAEYAILIALVIGVFSAMQIYIRRGVQARLRAGTDNIPDMIITQETDQAKVSNLFGTATQYEPYYIREGQYNFTTNSSDGTEKGAVTEQGGIKNMENAITQRKGVQEIKGAKED